VRDNPCRGSFLRLSGPEDKGARHCDIPAGSIVLGPELSGVINITAESVLNQIILIFGSCYILFDGGASLRFKVLKEVWITIVVIATVGVLITAGITAAAAFYVFEVPFIVALLLGATIASTDPATLVPIFKQVRIRDRVSQTVMSNLRSTMPWVPIITFAVLAVAMGASEFSVQKSLMDLGKQSCSAFLQGGSSAIWLQCS